MTRTLGQLDRARDLLVQRATEGLTADQERELESSGDGDILEYDLAAAIIEVGKASRMDKLPTHVEQAVLVAALSQLKGSAVFTAPALPAVAASMTVRAVPDHLAPNRRRFRPARLAVAAALAAAMAFGIVIGRRTAPADAPLAADRARSPRDLTEHPLVGAGISGIVTWDRDQQAGTLVLRGLQPNDPARERFQIWIVDGSRDPRYPVDGGLFDVTGEETRVRIAPHLKVSAADRILVTREGPDGAVVSNREAVVATAQLR